MPEQETISVEPRDNNVVVVTPTGDVDMSRSPHLRTALRGAHEQHPSRLVVNLADVDYMDSSGLATLVEAMRTAKTHKTEMVICGMSEKVRAIFEIARLHHFFTIVTSLDDALET